MNMFICLIAILSAIEHPGKSYQRDLPPVLMNELAKPILAPPECGDGLRFGAAITCTESLIMVADDGRRDGPPREGIVCTYEHFEDSWILIDTLQNPIPRPGDEFGFAMDCYKDRLIVGCPGDGMGGASGGDAWIFKRTPERWVAESRLWAEGIPSGSRFGEVVAIQGEYAAVGTPRFDGHSIWDVGRVDIFKRTLKGWTLHSTLQPPYTMSSLWFGHSLCFSKSDQSLFIGAPGFDSPTDRAGAIFHAHVNSKGDWKIQNLIQKSTPTPLERMGMSIAETGRHLFVGVPGSHAGGIDTGSFLKVQKGSTPTIVGEYFSPPYPYARLGGIVKASKCWIVCSMPAAQDRDIGIGRIRVYRIDQKQIRPICELYGREIDPPLGQAIAINNQYLITSGIYPEDEYPQPGRVWICDLNQLKQQ